LSWTQGDPNGDSVPGPFMDPSQDMVDLDLTPLGTNYEVRVKRIVGGFSNPIDAAIIGNKVYAIEYSGNQGVWEITFPPAQPRINISQATWSANGGFSFSFASVAGQTYQIQVSTNMLDWASQGSAVATNSAFQFVDPETTNFPQRFYRVASPGKP